METTSQWLVFFSLGDSGEIAVETHDTGYDLEQDRSNRSISRRLLSDFSFDKEFSTECLIEG